MARNILTCTLTGLLLMGVGWSHRAAGQNEPAPTPGTEYKVELTPAPFGLNHARFELWVPTTIGKADRIRAVIAMPLYQADRMIYELPAWRKFAADHRAVLLRHDMRTTVGDRENRLPIGEDATGAIFQALERLAGQVRHAELAHAGIVFTGLSQGGGQTTRLAQTVPQRTIAGIAFHGAAIPPADEHLPIHDVPILFPLGQEDGLTARVFPDLLAAMREHPVWAGLIQPNLPHHLLGDPQFILMWLDAVMAARLPETIPTDRPPALRKLDYDAGWLGAIRVNNRFQVSEASVRPVADLPADERVGHWLPNEQIARAWEIASLTGQVTGHEQAEELALTARRMTSAPTIDGDLGDWPKLTDAPWPAQILPHGLDWHGPDDSSLSLAVGYDADFVYLALAVRDDDLQLNGNAPWTADQDGVEIRLDARPAPLRMSNVGRGEGETFLIIGVGPGAESGRPNVVGALPDGAKVACQHDALGYRVEVRLPASYFNERQNGDWSRFRLNVTVDDDDADGRSQNWWRPDWRSETNWFGSGTVVKH